jgi:uncharacterized protein YfaS (alpha-2-macroglobulin family)
MKLVLTAAAALWLMPAAAFAQTAPSPAATPTPAPAAAPMADATAAPATGAKFNLDTPIEQIVADPAAHAILTADFGGQDVTTNPNYEQFKGMSLNAVAPYAPDKLTPELLKKIETDLATIK